MALFSVLLFLVAANTCNVPVIHDGYISGCLLARVDYQATCQFVCNVGFKSSEGLSQMRRTCKADGSWTGSDLICGGKLHCCLKVSNFLIQVSIIQSMSGYAKI